MFGIDEIEDRFGFHKATIEGENATLPIHRDTRIEFRKFASWLDVTIPDSRAKEIMMQELESASMWAHKSIASRSPLIRESHLDVP